MKRNGALALLFFDLVCIKSEQRLSNKVLKTFMSHRGQVIIHLPIEVLRLNQVEHHAFFSWLDIEGSVGKIERGTSPSLMTLLMWEKFLEIISSSSKNSSAHISKSWRLFSDILSYLNLTPIHRNLFIKTVVSFLDDTLLFLGFSQVYLLRKDILKSESLAWTPNHWPRMMMRLCVIRLLYHVLTLNI